MTGIRPFTVELLLESAIKSTLEKDTLTCIVVDWKQLLLNIRKYFSQEISKVELKNNIENFGCGRPLTKWELCYPLQQYLQEQNIKAIITNCSYGELDAEDIDRKDIDWDRLIATVNQYYDTNLKFWQLVNQTTDKILLANIIETIRIKVGDKIFPMDVINNLESDSEADQAVCDGSSCRYSEELVNYDDTKTLDAARRRVKREYDKLMDAYKDAFTAVSNIQFRHNKLIEQQECYKKIFKEQLSLVKSEAKYTFEQIVWDHLVIGFFGETNAGKSTIIEALRLKYSSTPGDHIPGDIIGNGQADFTKEASEYELNIGGHRVTLIDVPGIEGDEAKYSDIIKRALSKAHLIFYVQSKNKKPDSKIAEKIKDYLADWTRVYTIHNVRGNIGGYEDEEVLDTILTENNLKISREISDVFRATLKRNYNDIITMQGLLAVSVCSEYIEDDKKHKNYEKACRIFGSPDKVLDYSNFYSLVSLLKSCLGDVSDNIYKSNIQKIIGLRKKGFAIISETEKKQMKDIEALREALDKLRRDIANLVSRASGELERDYKTIITREFNIAKTSLCAVIDKDCGTDQKRAECADISRRLPWQITTALEYSIRGTCGQLQSNIVKKIKEFRRMSLRIPNLIQINGFNLDLDLGYDLEDLDINFEDIVNNIGTIAGWAAGGAFLGPVGAAIGAAIGAGICIVKGIFGDGGRGKAKQKVTAELDVCRKETISKVSEAVGRVRNQLENQRKSIDSKLLAEIKSLENTEDIVSQLSHKLKYISTNE